jgi:peptidoglycan hydrolase-like protein with peptidoglycan-binding domain
MGGSPGRFKSYLRVIDHNPHNLMALSTPQNQVALQEYASPPPDEWDESFVPLTSKAALDGRPPVLMMGEEDIYWMQRSHTALLSCGFNSTDEEIEAWIFGEATREAVLAFQASLSLPETGIVDRETWDALLTGDPTTAQAIMDDIVNRKVPTSDGQAEEYFRIMEARFARDEEIQKLAKQVVASPLPPPPTPAAKPVPLPLKPGPSNPPLSPILSSLIGGKPSSSAGLQSTGDKGNASEDVQSMMGGFGIKSFSDEEREVIEKLFASASGNQQPSTSPASTSSTFVPLSKKSDTTPTPISSSSPLPAPAAVKKWPIIQEGDGGADVRSMQAALTNVGFYCGEEDMQWWQVGEPTRQALLTFQSSVKLPQTGVCDQQTWLALLGPNATPEDIKRVKLEGNDEYGAAEYDTDMTDSTGRVWLIGEQRWSKP